MKTSISLCILFLHYLLIIPAKAESAYRLPETDYRFYQEIYQQKNPLPDYIDTPLRLARFFPEAVLRDAVKWPSYKSVERYFKRVRDYRFLSHKDQLRRISWLYPDDGCYARAALAIKILKDPSIPVKSADKIFVFGNLKAETANSPKGNVSWWYHVAPVVQVNQQKYVLDPALQIARPLKLEEWITLMGDSTQIKIAICASGTYLPGSNCGMMSDGVEGSAQLAQKSFLDLEWARLLQLGRDPENELGDRPPWRKKEHHEIF